jgi:SAM-dependent methyltransferase
LKNQPTISDQKAFYDNFYLRDKIDLPVVRLKEAERLRILERLVGPRVYRRALVVGCGQGLEIPVLKAEVVVGIDLSLIALNEAQKSCLGAKFVQADGLKLPFAPESFDVIICSEVMEHVLEPKKLVEEMARVSASGGKLLVTTPNWISLWGLARWVAERILKRPVTADDQPVDEWFTPGRLRSTLEPHFIIRTWHGMWYFPPTGKGRRRLPDRMVVPIFRLLMPIDRLLGRLVPRWGNLHLVSAVRRS